MNDSCQRYRLLLAEQQKLREHKLDAETDLILYAKHPEYFTPETIAEVKVRHEQARTKLDAIAQELLALQTAPDVQRMLAAALGLTPAGAPAWEPVLRPFTMIAECKVPWLWYPYLPLGRLTILEGDPGQGKTWFALAMATCVSQGSWLEIDGEEENHREPAGVVYLSCEDDPEDTTKKRLRVLQADQSRIFELIGKARMRDRVVATLTLKDIPILKQAVKDTKAKLLVVDPIQGYLAPGTDMNRAEQVRPLLAALQRLAKEEEVAVLLVRHLAKGTAERAVYKGLGSIDFIAAARSVLLCAEQKELAEWTAPTDGSKPMLVRRTFAVAQVKNNLTACGPAVQFELRRDSFLWLGTVDLTADQLLAPVVLTGIGDSSLQEAKKFSLYTLQNGIGRPVTEIRAEAKKAGISWDALVGAKAALSIESRLEGDIWHWVLPEKYITH